MRVDIVLDRRLRRLAVRDIKREEVRRPSAGLNGVQGVVGCRVVVEIIEADFMTLGRQG